MNSSEDRSYRRVLFVVRIAAPSPPHADNDTDRNTSGGERDNGDLRNPGDSSRNLQEAKRHPERPHTDRQIESTAGTGTAAILVNGRENNDCPGGTDDDTECRIRNIGE